MISGMGVHIVSGVLGLLLVTTSLTLFLSGYASSLRRGVEDIFIPGKDLFAARESYSGTVTFLRWSGLLFGLLLVLPTFVIVDIILAAIAFFLWRYFVRRAHSALTQ